MANTQKYLNHLLQNTGITPACSEEERAAADIIAKTFANHGFTPEVQEFSASGSAKVVQAALGIVAFLGAVLVGIGGVVGIVGLLLTIVAAVLFTMERTGKPVLSQLGAGGLSQNVIAYHKASGPLASPRNRPVVVVAHYDSPRADLLCQEPYVSYRPMLVKLLPYAMLAPAVLAVVRLLPVPDAAKIILWVLAIVAALVPLANAIAIIANRFVLPYTTGSVCNKSSVAAMLGVMDAVSPYQGHGEEFPQDVPFEEYFAEQRRAAEEAAAAAAAAVAAETAYPHELAEDEAAEGEVDAEGEFEGDQLTAGETGVMSADDTVAGDVADGAGVAATGEGADADVAQPVAEDGQPVTGETATFSVVDAPSPDSTVAMNMADVLDAASVAAATAVAVGEAAGTAPVAPAVPVAAVPVPASEVAESADVAAAPTPAVEAEPESDASDEPSLLNAAGNYRFGEDAIRSLGMLPSSCAIVYEHNEEEEESEQDDEPELTAFDVEPAVDDWQPVPVVAEEPEFYDEEYAEAEPVLYPEEDGAVEQDDSDASDDAEPIDVAPEDVQETAYAAEESSDDDEPARFYDPDATSFIMAAIDIEQLDDEPVDAAAEVSAEGDAAEDASDGEVGATIEQPALDLEAGNTVAAEPVDSPGDEEPVEAEEDVESEPEAEPAAEVAAESDGQPVAEQSDGSEDAESTQMFSATPEVADDPSHTIAMPAAPVETVDSLMAEISSPAPAPARAPQVRSINVPSTADAPVPHTPDTANRASLFDLPDPSATPADPFASPGAVPSVPSPAQVPAAAAAPEASEASSVVDRVGTISAPAPQPEKQRHGLGRLFGRKKKQNDSMSEWLGVDEGFDAKTSGSDIGSWDNFEDDDTGWRGGATGADGLTEADLREAITSMGDDELLGHDIWFVATGASENGNAGIKAFLREHRDKLRGVFLINLECVGAGQVAMVATEGERRVLKGDKRIMKLVSRVSADFHHEYGALDMPYVTTDAHAAMSMSLRSLTIAGVEGAGFALGHTEEDQPYNVDADNIALVSDVVTEVIRRS